MATFIINVFKKLLAFWFRILPKRHPAAKAVESRAVHREPIDGLVHGPYLKRLNQQLILKIWIFKAEKPPPLNYASNP